ncbi:MAG: chemotaxis protein CheW [Porticoccaceae bacterium]
MNIMNTNAALAQDFDQDLDTKQYLSFVLAEEEYAVDILCVQEIRSWEKVTAIPNTPDYVTGVINLRGVVVPVIDLRIRFGLAKAEFNANTVIVVVNIEGNIEGKSGDRVIGMVVDAVSDVYNFAAEVIGNTPDLGGAISTEFVKGLATVDDKMIILLDIDLLINIEILEVGSEKY